MVSLKKYEIRVRRVGVGREPAQQARRVLRAAHDHPPADPAGGLRQRDLLARRRSERQDDGTCDPGRWRVAGGVPEVASSCSGCHSVRSQRWHEVLAERLEQLRSVHRDLLKLAAGSWQSSPRRHLHQSIIRVDVIDRFRRDELVLDEDRRRHRPPVKDVERDGDDFRAVLLGKIRD